MAARLGEQALVEAAEGSRLRKRSRGCASASSRRSAVGLTREQPAPPPRGRAVAPWPSGWADPDADGARPYPLSRLATRRRWMVRALPRSRAVRSRSRHFTLFPLPGPQYSHGPFCLRLARRSCTAASSAKPELLLEQSLDRATAAAGSGRALHTCLFHLADLERRAGNWARASVSSPDQRPGSST